jgi:photoactive yellow protein
MQTDVDFNQQGMAELLAAMDVAALDGLEFGVIGFDLQHRVRRYNAYESRAAGLGAERVLDQDLFLVVAPCLNNFLVAQRFIEAREADAALDETINYVLTLRMRPTKVRLRLLAAPQAELAYVLVQRL